VRKMYVIVRKRRRLHFSHIFQWYLTLVASLIAWRKICSSQGYQRIIDRRHSYLDSKLVQLKFATTISNELFNCHHAFSALMLFNDGCWTPLVYTNLASKAGR
jgi:hypothetical protein